MIWQVSDTGKVEVRLRAEGEEQIKVAREHADRFFGNVVGDLATSLGIETMTDELRYSFNKNRPEVTITWRAQVPVHLVPDVREYMIRLATSHDPVRGEIVEPPDQ